MKKWTRLIILLVATSLTTPALADLKKGHKAFNEKDYVTSFQEYLSAANEGANDAKYYLALQYFNGRGTPQNYDEAGKLFGYLATIGHGESQYRMGMMTELGLGFKKHRGTAAKYYEAAIKNKHALSALNLGLMYEQGEGNFQRGQGIKQDILKAIEYYRVAADWGNDAAQYNMGLAYRNGRGVKQNDVTAIEWYQKAAKQGNAPAQANLGYMYVNGFGVEKSYPNAYKHLFIAARKGNVQAYYTLANMYQLGLGVPSNLLLTHVYYRLAAQNNFYDARAKADAFAKQMTPQLKAESDKLFTEWSTDPSQIF